MFQSRCGFSPRRDDSGGGGDSPNPEFQSRCGFSPRRDLSQSVQRPPRGLGFNPVVGFLPVATPQCRPGRLTPAQFQSRCGFSPRRDTPVSTRSTDSGSVSIPLWVFSPSRPELAVDVATAVCFNPVVGFLPVATRQPRRRDRQRVLVSIPLWVFSPSRPRCCESFRRATPGFNPVVGFLPVATHRLQPGDLVDTTFQSRCGFSPRRDRKEARARDRRDLFQSRCGFSPRRDLIALLDGL